MRTYFTIVLFTGLIPVYDTKQGIRIVLLEVTDLKMLVYLG